MAVLDVGNLGRGRHEVVEEGRRERCALVVVDEVLVEHPADPLHDAARDLAFHDHRVDHDAAVLAHHVAQHRDHAGVGIDLDGAHVARVRPRDRRCLVPHGRLEAGRQLGRKLTRRVVRDRRDLARG